MSRFRFRVWDTKDKEYLDPNYFEGCYLLPDGSPHVGMTIYNGICDEYTAIPPKQLIVEQCTGLRDKNGTLIYEGDIVCYDDTLYSSYATKMTGVVVYRKASFCYKYSDCFGGLYQPLVPSDDFWQRKTEIIGNVHDMEVADENSN